MIQHNVTNVIRQINENSTQFTIFVFIQQNVESNGKQSTVNKSQDGSLYPG
jgi:hypothetical protein